jgi:hypothetical protein
VEYGVTRGESPTLCREANAVVQAFEYGGGRERGNGTDEPALSSIPLYTGRAPDT